MRLLSRLRQPVYFVAGVLSVVALYFTVLVANRIFSGPPGSPLPVPDITFEAFNLANGLQVLVHRDPSAAGVAIEVWYHVGSKDEPPGKAGLAHVTEHLLFSPDERTENGLAADFERLGAWDYNGLTNRDRTRFMMTVPKPALDAALWLESERMSGIADRLTEKTLVEARRTVLNEIRRNESDGAVMIEMAEAKAAFPGDHPYSRSPSGNTEEIESISLDDVRRWVASYYTPSNAAIAVAGDVDPATVRRIFQTYFGAIPRGNRPPRWTSWVAESHSSRHYTVEMPVSAPKLGLLWVVPGYGSPEADYLDLTRHILESRLLSALGGGAASSIEIELRSFELCGLFVLAITKRPDATDSEIEIEVARQIDKLASEGPAEAEIEDAAERIVTSLLYDSERVGGPGGKAGILALSQVLAGDPDAFSNSMARIQTASKADITRVVSAWISSRSATRITIQPVAKPKQRSSDERPRAMPTINWADATSSAVAERFELANGLDVFLIRRKGSIEGVKLAWPAPSGGARSERAMFRLTHRLLSLGPTESVAHRVREKHGNRAWRFVVDAEGAGGSIGFEFPAGNLAEALELLSAMVTNVSFDEERIGRAKQGLRVEYRERREGPPRRAVLTAAHQLLFDDPDVVSRAIETALTADGASVKRFYRRWFNPGRAAVIIAADQSPDSLRSLLEAQFGSWTAFDDEPAQETGARSIESAPIYVIDRPGDDYAVITCAAAIPHDATVGRHVVEIISGVLSARINQRLRARAQLSYEAIAFYERWPREHVVSLLADARYSDVPVVLRALRRELDSLGGKQPFSEHEFDSARVALSKRLPQLFDGTSLALGAVAKAAQADLLSLPSAKEILGVSYAEARLAASYFRGADRYVWVIAGDSSRILEDIRHLGLRTQSIAAEP